MGLRVAAWLVGRGARRLILLGRTVPPPRREWAQVGDQQTLARIAAIQALETAGATVRCVAADVTDHEQMRRALDPDALDLPPIRGCVHAAGSADNWLMRDLDDERIRSVMAAKVGGALILHELFPPGRLDFLVLFSSAGQLLNLPGQSAYAAANAFLDGLARHRRADGAQDTISLAWTSWRGLGLSVSAAAINAELNARGTADLTAEEALLAWERVSMTAEPNLAVLRVQRDSLRGSEPVLLRELRPVDTTPAEQAAIWSTPRGPELLHQLRDQIRAAAADALKIPPEKLQDKQPLREQGIDSLLAVTVRQQLEQRLDIGLSQTLLWEQPTIAAIADHLAAEHGDPPA
ncbi:beta-ketoacyl reductase [Kibdelosporangium phytohabitans]|uniref:beta-ketoacyl reductase n=1 Tax=Kibdelosporangium phytohabitans TaxID=860235 RepID=UPI001F3284B3|nr:beta-ketoacyl reductase [Kibdelosporangium phytohabitans]